MPKESKALRAAAEKKLTDIPKPGLLEPTPLKHLPRLGTHALSGIELEILIAAPPDLVQSLLVKEDDRRLKERAERRAKEAADEKDPKRKQALLDAKPGAGEQLTFQEMRNFLSAPPSPGAMATEFSPSKETRIRAAN